MNDIEKMLEELAHKTMFHISDKEMPALIEEYHVFMEHVKALEVIDTQGIEPLAYPYDIKTTFLREDVPDHQISQKDALKNASSIQDNQIKVPKVIPQ